MLSENQQIYDDYFQLRVLGIETKKLYWRAILSWSRYTGIPLAQIDKESLSTWYKKASDHYSYLTIEKYGTQLRTLYAFNLEQTGMSKRKARAEALELFDVIPFRDLRQRAKKESKLRDKIVTPREFQTIMKATNSPRMRALLSLTYESGCRKGEVFSLRLRDIQANEQYWTISVEGKTGPRTVPLFSSIPYLKAWIQQHPDRDNENAALFVTSFKGIVRPMNPISFNTGLRKLCAKAGIRNLYPHQFRHTRLTELAKGGVGEYQLKSFAGWTPSSTMANKYVHLSGKGHVNAVLGVSGVEVEQNGAIVKPLLELSRCPNCDEHIDPKWIQCPACQFILDSATGIKRLDRLSELEAKLEAVMKLVEAKDKKGSSRP